MLFRSKQVSHPSHRPLEISPTARDSHIPTARLRPGWKSGKPRAGFPLSHAGLATMNPVYRSKDLQHHNHRAGGPAERKAAAGAPFCLPRFQDRLVLESKVRFRIILRFENAEPASASPARLNLKQRNLAAKKNAANSEVSPSAVSQNLTRCTGVCGDRLVCPQGTHWPVPRDTRASPRRLFP